MASTTLDLPHPFGPTMQVMPVPLNVIGVFSQKDLKTFPVLGFFNVYYFRFSFVADHFQYLASMGPLALAAAGMTRIPALLKRGQP
jgi:hypothetical protein